MVRIPAVFEIRFSRPGIEQKINPFQSRKSFFRDRMN